MPIKCLSKQTAGVGFLLLLLSGCDALRAAQDDFSRLTSSRPASTPSKQATAPAPAASPARSAPQPASKVDPAKVEPQSEAKAAANGGSFAGMSPIGKNEGEVRALFGPPNNEEERAPGKVWRYRDGQCTMDIQFYPDVQTRQFGTLAYEVKSDDNTDEGKRGCLAQFKSRAQARNG
jgi:hypothetical protein